MGYKTFKLSFANSRPSPRRYIALKFASKPINNTMAEAKQQDIPSATRVSESVVLSASKDAVWAAIRGVDFKWASDVKSVDVSGDASSVGGTRTINYADGTKQTVIIVELSDLRSSVTYTVTASEPAVSYSSASHTISVKEVSNPSDGVAAQSFVEWTSDYSNDAKVNVIEDSRYKKKEGFKAMAAFFAKADKK